MIDVHHLTLEFARADEAGDPHAFRTGTQDYVLRSSGGDYAGVTLRWNDALLNDLASLRRPRPDAAVVQSIGEVLRKFVAPSGWQRRAAEALANVTSGRTVVLTIRSAAAEIYALPWELLTLANGQHLGAHDHVLLRYEVPGAAVVAPRSLEGGRIVLAWSAAGGDVPASRHKLLIADACARGHHPFDPATDVVAHVTLERLTALVEPPEVRVLHLLAHGATAGERSHGLALDTGDGGRAVVDPAQLSRALAPHADHLRMVVLCACDSGNAGELGNPLGSLAYALHRAGVALVVASRFPLSVEGSALLTEAFYDSLLGGPTAVETALIKARRRLLAESATLDWASIQLYVRAADGADSRPVVFRPYRGLLAYQPPDARFFFGRDAERTELLADLDALRDAGRPRFLVVAGASGTGKSSMVLAGAVPDLLGHQEAAHHRDETVEVSRIVDALRRLLPTYDPPAVRQSLELLVQLSPGVKSSVSGWRYFTLRPGARPMQALDAVLEDVSLRDGPVLIIVDQFEELFTQCPDPTVREKFARRLWSLARLSDAATHVIITIRVDYLGQCGELTVDESGLRLDRIAYDEAFRVFVAQMTPQQMRSAIEEPAHKVGLTLEAGLVDRMLADVEGEPGALPLLSYTLDLLWQARAGRMLTQAAYDTVGGVAGALHGRAEAIIGALNPHEQHQARRLLVRLVAVEDGAWDARRRVRIDDVRPALLWDVASFDLALAALVDARLLVQGREGEHATVELAHEALIRRWARLREWIVEDQEMLAQVNTVERWVAAWQSFGTLLLDDQLGYASQVRDQYETELSDDARALIRESEAQLERAVRRKRWVFIGTFAVTVAVALTMLGLGIYGLAKKSQAEENSAKAREEAREARDQSERAKAATRVSVARGLEYRDPLAASLFLLEFAGVNGVDASPMAGADDHAAFIAKSPPAGAHAVAHRLLSTPAPVRRLGNAKVIDERFRSEAERAGADPPSIRFARSGEVLTAVDGLVRVHGGPRAVRLACDPAKASEHSVLRFAFARDGQGPTGKAVALWEEATRSGVVTHRLCAAHANGTDRTRLPISPGLPRPQKLSVSDDGTIVAALWARLPCALATLGVVQPATVSAAVRFAQGLPDDVEGEAECALIVRWIDGVPAFKSLDRPVTAFDFSASGRELLLAQRDLPGTRLTLETLEVDPLDAAGLSDFTRPFALRYSADGSHVIGDTPQGVHVWSPQGATRRLMRDANERVSQVEARGRTTAFLLEKERTQVGIVFDGELNAHDTDLEGDGVNAEVSRMALVDGANPRVGLLRAGKHWQFVDLHTPLMSPRDVDGGLLSGLNLAEDEDVQTQQVDLPDWPTKKMLAALPRSRPAPLEEMARPSTRSARRESHTIEACHTDVRQVRVGPRGRVLLVVTGDEVCLLPTTADGWVQHLPVPGVIDVDFRADGRQVALLTDDGASSIWPVDPVVPRRLLASARIDQIWFPQAGPSAEPVLYGLDERAMLHRWRLSEDPQAPRAPLASVERVISTSGDGAWAIVSDAPQPQLRALWDARPPTALMGFEVGATHQFNPDATRLAQLVPGGVRLWRLPPRADASSATPVDPGVHLPAVRLDSQARTIWSPESQLAWSPDGRTLAAMTDDMLFLWQIEPKVVAQAARSVRPGSRIFFDPQSAHLLIDSGLPMSSRRARRASDRVPQLIRVPLASANTSAQLSVPEATRFGEAKISPDGRFVVASGEVDGSIDRLLVWSLVAAPGAQGDPTAEQPRVIQSQDAVDGYEINGWSFAAYEDGGAQRNFVLIRSNVGAIERRALDGGERLDGTLVGHTSVVEGLAWHPSGKLATWDSDDGMRVWLARDMTGAQGLLSGRFTSQLLDDGAGNLQSAIFSPDGRWLVARSGQGRVWAWPLAWPSLMRQLRDRTDACLTAEERVRYLGGQWDKAQASAAVCPPPQPR